MVLHQLRKLSWEHGFGNFHQHQVLLHRRTCTAPRRAAFLASCPRCPENLFASERGCLLASRGDGSTCNPRALERRHWFRTCKTRLRALSMHQERGEADSRARRSQGQNRRRSQRSTPAALPAPGTRVARHAAATLRPDQARLFVAFEAPVAFTEAASSAQQFLLDNWSINTGVASETDGSKVPALPPVRWTSPDSWHITLHFIGTTARERIPEVLDRLNALAKQHHQVTLMITTIAALPPMTSQKPLRVLCLELEEVADRDEMRTLSSFVAGLADQLAPFHLDTAAVDLQGIPRQTQYRPSNASPKPYMPHLTLGRVKDWASSASRARLRQLVQHASAGAWKPSEGSTVRFTQFKLYESVWDQTNGPPSYKPIATFELG